MPASWKWDRVVAPKTTKTAWQSDTCRDRPTRRPRLANTRTKATVEVAVSSREPSSRAGSTRAKATTTSSTRVGNRRLRAWVNRARPGRHPLGQERLADADPDGGQVGAGQADEAADGGGPEGLDHQQGEQDG